MMIRQGKQRPQLNKNRTGTQEHKDGTLKKDTSGK
jgi:hypothetical protein